MAKEGELSLEEQVELAEAMFAAVDRRNELFQRYPKWEQLSVFIHENADNWDEYLKLEKEAGAAIKIFREAIADRRPLIDYLIRCGRPALAKRLERINRLGMFRSKLAQR